jgi:adenosylhomocysteine nucleosidase
MALRSQLTRAALFVLALLTVIAIATGHGASPSLVAVIGIPREIAPVEQRIEGSRVETLHGLTFTIGTTSGRRVIAVRTGVGKVNAAMAATLLLDHYSPAAVLLSGTAGAIDPGLSPGDVVMATGVGHHDVGSATSDRFLRAPTRSPATGKLDPVFFPADPALLAAARTAASAFAPERLAGFERERSPVVREGLIVTGDAFMAKRALRDELRHELNAIAVEMEGAAVAQVCARFGVPLLVIRSITDRADGDADSSYQRLVDGASRSAADLVLATIHAMNAEVPVSAR